VVADDEESHRFMTADEVRAVARSECIEIGGHASSHQQLSILDEEEQRAEILGGRHALRAITGASVETFAYPFGGPEAFDDTSERLAAEAGFHLACAGFPGVVRRRTPRYRLPRFVVKDWSGPEFAARLDSWFRHYG
jgi:peptidoglycan/xylan/chitin deacetylase (PgdA/CDA1 family)